MSADANVPATMPSGDLTGPATNSLAGAAADAPGAPAGRAPFTSQLRARAEPLRLGADDATDRWMVRVQVPEVWDAVKVSTPSTEPVVALKVRALEALYPGAAYHEAFVMKLHGIEVRDENQSLASAGAANGSIFLLTHRRRRPVR